jgi:uncharacterized protein
VNTRVIISHGTLGHPGRAWFPWLAAQLDKLGVEAILPEYPTPEDQGLDTWIAAFENTAGTLKASDILVGHSLGAVLALRLLERSKVSIRGTFLAAVFAAPLGNLRFDALQASFIEPPFDWAAIRRSAGLLKSYSSDDDPFVPLPLGLEVASALGIEPVIINQGGHLNANSGYAEFPLLLNDLLPLIKQNCR